MVVFASRRIDMPTNFSDEVRATDLAVAEHAIARYQHYTDLQNSGAGKPEHDEHKDKHEKTFLGLCDKYGYHELDKSIIFVIKNEPIPAIAD